jgi:hypothetical protein
VLAKTFRTLHSFSFATRLAKRQLAGVTKPLRSRKRDIQTLLNTRSKRTSAEAYAEDEHPVLRFLVGAHRASSPEVFRGLAADPTPWVRPGVAYNNRAPVSIWA